MRQLREAGPTYLKLIIDEFADITFLEDCGPDNEVVIDRGAEQLPSG
jgi:phenolic acid decarboxylase